MHKPVTIVILAAGLGTRMKSRQAKVLHKAGGKTLLQHVLDTAFALAPPERIFAVVGHQAGQVRQSVAGAVMVADLNGDGIPDIGLMEAGTLGIFLGKGNGTFATPYYIGAGENPGNVVAVNLHGQPASAGRPDIVVPDLSGGVMVLINTSK